jgi:hypothetical protein
LETALEQLRFQRVRLMKRNKMWRREIERELEKLLRVGDK